jgi:hypothetical protein
MTKHDHIAGFKKEVQEFHPFLKGVFSNIKEILDVEYTHGQNEMGADFLLKREDPITHDHYWVGVIVKVGKIHSSLQDIERQVKECRVPRMNKNGGELIINTIWVMTNSSISENSKRKIGTEYSAQAITFFDIDKVVALADKALGDTWHTDNTFTRNYLSDLKTSFEETDKQCDLIILPDGLTIDQDIVEKKSNYVEGKKKNAQHKVNLVEQVRKQKVSFLEGGFGSGKSKQLRQLAIAICKKNTDSNIEVPVLVAFTDLIAKYQCDLDILFDQRFSDEVYKEIGDQHKIILLIDAVDESPINESEKLKHIENLIQQVRSKNIHILFSSRSIRGTLKKGTDDVKNNKIYEIQPLSATAVIKFIEKVCKSHSLPSRIYNDINNSGLIRDMARTPIAAILLAKLLQEERNDLPSTLTELFNKYVELSLGRWDVDKGLASEKEYRIKNVVLERIAIYIIDNKLPNIGVGEALNFFENYMSERNNEKLTAEVVYKNLVARSGIVIECDGRFRFKHKSIIEYLYAQSQAKNQSLKMNAKAYEHYWQNIYFFYFGCRNDCEKEMRAVFDIKPTTIPQRMLKFMGAPSFLLAAYSTPYNTISNALLVLFEEMGDLYLELRDSEESPFSKFPEMHYLWLFQIFARESYSYTFFRKALDDIILELDAKEDSDAKVYAMFCVAMIKVELGDHDALDFLIEHRGKLPLQIQLGIFHEAHLLKKKPEEVKRYIHKMQNALKRGKLGDKNFLKKIYDDPMHLHRSNKRLAD